jgi:hypothetical protein
VLAKIRERNVSREQLIETISRFFKNKIRIVNKPVKVLFSWISQIYLFSFLDSLYLVFLTFKRILIWEVLSMKDGNKGTE